MAESILSPSLDNTTARITLDDLLAHLSVSLPRWDRPHTAQQISLIRLGRKLVRAADRERGVVPVW